MFAINIASPVYERWEALQVYKVTFTENIKNKPKDISMQSTILSQSLDLCHLLAGAHMPYTPMLLMENPEAFYALMHTSLWLISVGSETNTG